MRNDENYVEIKGLRLDQDMPENTRNKYFTGNSAYDCRVINGNGIFRLANRKKRFSDGFISNNETDLISRIPR